MVGRNILRVAWLVPLLVPLFVLSVSGLFPVWAQESTIRIPKPRTSFDISHDYHVQLLKLALTAADPQWAKNVKLVSVTEMVQGRAEAELIKGKLIDIYWLGAHSERDSRLIAIKVPTSKGLIGFRKFIVTKASKDKIANINHIEQLQKLIACQGSHWPDTEILNHNKIPVTTSPVFSQLFEMLDKGRCDYFPRGYHDADREVVSLASQYPDLVSSEALYFYYPFAIYFYTGKQNQALANRLAKGMEIIANNGLLQKHIESHPLTAHIFPLFKQQQAKVIVLNNPLMPSNSQLNNADYFFQLNQFNFKQLN
ncbi:hypothetical protein [Colwellia sp. MEBiC06753]